MPDTSKSFADVLAYELEAVRCRRNAVSNTGIPKPLPADADTEKLRHAALDDGLVGLALSGGGVRSATFCLGFLQGLSRLGLLTAVDYLSTVSGGGYAGGWLTAWIHREELNLGPSGTANVEKQLNPDRKAEARADRMVNVAQNDQPLADTLPRSGDPPRPAVLDDEPEPVYHLRAYSNYLAPRPGWLSGDMWTLFAIYARNTLVNLLILVPLVFVAILVAYGVVWWFAQPGGPWSYWLAAAALLLALSALLEMGKNLVPLDGSPAAAADSGWWEWVMTVVRPERTVPRRWRFNALVVGATAVAAVLAAWMFSFDPAMAPRPAADHHAADHAADPALVVTFHTTPTDRPGEMTVGPVKARVPADAARPEPHHPDPGAERWGGPPRPSPSLAAVTAALGPAAVTDKLYEPWLRYPAYYELNNWLDERGIHPVLKFVLTFGLVGCIAGVFGSILRLHRGGGLSLTAVASPVVLGLAFGALCGPVLVFTVWPLAAYPAAVAAVGPPVFLVALAVAGFVESALLSGWLTEHDREWRSRLAATLALLGAGWLAFFGTVFFLAPGVRALFPAQGFGPETILPVAGWVATTVGGLFAANSVRTGGDGARKPSWVLGLIAAVGPIVFLVGLLCLLGVLAGMTVGVPYKEHLVFAYGSGAGGAALVGMGGIALVCGVGAYFLSRLTDVNVFSMHALYGNRLVRGFLGASRRKVHATDEDPGGRLRRGAGGRWEWLQGPGGAPTGVGGPVRRENPVTGFDRADDIPLADLRPWPGVPFPLGYTGPYQLIGTALNLVAGDELAVQDRRASSFVLSPGFCGSDETGYAATPAGGNANALTLGRAMTISGAAADPNMSVHQSAAVTALMTVFNVRLGWWMENPRFPAAATGWAAAPPKAGMLSSLYREFFGLTDARGRYVHLSDGGHFDNTGVYELVRRRCRYVVQVDAAADPDDRFEDLGQLVRRVRADFGIRIEIDPTPVRRGADRLSKWHVAVGRIRYDDVDANALAGTLVYVRPTRTGDEPADVHQYADTHADFPHRTTADQFFDNDQFEAYRMLGEHVAFDVFEDAVQVAPRWPAKPGAPADDYRRAVRSLFAEVHGRWYPPPAGIDAAFQQAGRDGAEMLKQFREDKSLAGLIHDVYPELPPAAPNPAPNPAPGGDEHVELLALYQQLDVMERAWLGIRLGTHYDHPINRGWMNAFRRWSSSATFHKVWPVIRGEFGKGFVRFCERALNLPAYTAVAVKYVPARHAAQVKRLDEEFTREWGSRLGRVEERRVQRNEWVRAMRANNPVAAATGPVPVAVPVPFFEDAADHHLVRLAHTVATRWAAWPTTPYAAVWPVVPYAAAWMLYLGEFGPGGRITPVGHLADHPVGLLAVVPRDTIRSVPQYEVVFWVRPAYRSLGLGRSAVEHPMASDRNEPLYQVLRDEIRRAHPGAAVHLWSHYPADLNTRGDRPQRGMWLNFFHDYDFHRYDRPPAVAGTEPPWISVRYEATA